MRSLITLKGLTYAPTGGIVAAATTSLPEEIGGVRNWDYRYCWLRDATFTLFALVNAGYHDEAKCVARMVSARDRRKPRRRCKSLYGVRGERRLDEYEIPWLSGYENSKPVRIGNAATQQFQLDVYGEIVGAIYRRAPRRNRKSAKTDWRLQVALLNFLETKWKEPDEGIWEVRGGRRQFTHSKMMAWLAFDRAVRLIEECGFAPADHHSSAGRKMRDANPSRSLRARLQRQERKRLPNFTARTRWMRAFCSCRSSVFFRADDPRVRATRSKRSSAI